MIKSDILDDFNEAFKSRAKTVFNQYVIQQKIRKYKGEYYYDEKVSGNKMSQFLLLYGKTLMWIALLALFIILVIYLGN